MKRVLQMGIWNCLNLKQSEDKMDYKSRIWRGFQLHISNMYWAHPMRYEEIVTAHIAMKNEMNVHLPQAVYLTAPLKQISNSGNFSGKLVFDSVDKALAFFNWFRGEKLK